MSGRVIAIGDIHGYLVSLEVLLDAIEPQPGDTIVTLGDYCDRGPDTRGVIDRLMALAGCCRLVPLIGNHDEMLLESADGDRACLSSWLLFGGDATLASYGTRDPAEIPEEHLQFLERCRDWFETDRHFFVHANYVPHLPLDCQPAEVTRWRSLRDELPGPHRSGKIAVVGHTAQHDFEIFELGHLKCIDTCCYGGGWLTALEVSSGKLWQASAGGTLRERRV